MTITPATLAQLKSVDIRTVDPDSLVDISDVTINTDLPLEPRILDYLQKIRNPYCYKCNGMIVKLSFSGKQSLEDCLRSVILFGLD